MLFKFIFGNKISICELIFLIFVPLFRTFRIHVDERVIFLEVFQKKGDFEK